MVIQPRRRPNCSWSTFATGARQLVVHEAFETMWCRAGVVAVVVDAEDHGQVRALGGRRDDDLLRAPGEVAARRRRAS